MRLAFNPKAGADRSSELRGAAAHRRAERQGTRIRRHRAIAIARCVRTRNDHCVWRRFLRCDEGRANELSPASLPRHDLAYGGFAFGRADLSSQHRPSGASSQVVEFFEHNHPIEMYVVHPGPAICRYRAASARPAGRSADAGYSIPRSAHGDRERRSGGRVSEPRHPAGISRRDVQHPGFHSIPACRSTRSERIIRPSKTGWATCDASTIGSPRFAGTTPRPAGTPVFRCTSNSMRDSTSPRSYAPWVATPAPFI